MNRSTRGILFIALGVSCLVGGLPSRVFACATCAGDPNSPMTHGAVMGVIFMIGVAGFVLAGIAGTSVFWMIRARRPNGNVDHTHPGAA